MAAGWAVEHLSGPAAALHARDLPDPVARTVWVCSVHRPALVLGSAQSLEGDVDPDRAARAGIDLARRRSGGGAVLLHPGDALWVDVLVPRSDPLWDDDVGRATHWLGATWARALGRGHVHREGLCRTRWSRLVCFAGVGPGEVVDAGRKLVGISARRERAGARFQCVVLRRWDPTALIDLLALAPAERSRAALELSGVAAGSPVALAELEAAFLTALPA